MKATKSKSGFALVTVIGIITVLSIVFAMLYKINSQTVFSGKRIKNKTKSNVYAEAGIEFAYSVIRDDFGNRTNSSLFRLDTSSTKTNGASLKSTYGKGSFTLKLTPIGSQYVVVNSVGECGNAESEVEVLIEDTNYADYDSIEAFTKAIAAGGTAAVSGNGFLSASGNTPTIHSNDKITVNGNISVSVDIASSTEIDLKNKTIDGSATAPVVSSSGTATGGKVVTSVPPISIPTIDLTPYYNRAVANSTFYTALNGTYEIKSDIAPAGGILYVDGDVKIYANVTGTVIATGNITVVGGGVKESGSGIAMASDTGNIVLRSTGDSEGLVYSRTGDFEMNASGGTLTGQVIVGGEVSKTGGASMIFEPSPPDYEYLGANPVISAWQK